MYRKFFHDTDEERPLYFFEDLSRIPRESGHEDAIAAYLMDFAEGLGLEHMMDEAGNVIIKKPGSKGREDEPAVILQAHMDMVCEKTSDSSHDFSKDPIELLVSGDMLRANKTTLGADDGIGVAMCMASVYDDALSHPPIEVLITVEEETTFKGAAGADPKFFDARRVINLDHAVEHQVLAGSCGGEACQVDIPVEMESAPQDGFDAEVVSIDGMNGGHSGEDIHRGYGSAIQLIIRLLRKLFREVPGVRLAGISGGTNRLAISRDAKATVLIPSESSDAAKSVITGLSDVFRAEYGVASKGIKVTQKSAETAPEEVLTAGSAENIIGFMSVCPDGLQKMNGAIRGVVESSLNIGEMRLTDGCFQVVAELRGAFRSTVDDMQEKIEVAAGLFGGKVTTHDRYSPWPYDPDSKLRKKAISVYKDLFGESLEPMVVHAGIECGLFMDTFEDLDAISLGPDCWSFHSPDEHMSISSAKREWKFLKALLANI